MTNKYAAHASQITEGLPPAVLEFWIEQAKALLNEAGGEVERWKVEHGIACKLVADMHAAAVGSSRGPIHGVLEDVADLRTERDALQAQVAALQADAERYRWLADDHAELDTRKRVAAIAAGIVVHGKGYIDATIDAARTKEPT